MSFKKVRSVIHPDQNCLLTEYAHEQSGMRHFHLESDFPEMVFALSLPTPPEDDTGMPHILEHITLSGSDKYPVKDPFNAMLNRSVAHDMNALTSALHTTYHFSTTLNKDFDNLSDLYLDLVFNPLLRQSDFEQEGWRLERDPAGVWTFKGVVLNEMKGNYSSDRFLLHDAINEVMAPNTPSSRSSGGHPLAIVGLSYERLRAFHQKFYNPSKAVLCTSGAIDVAALHERLDDTIARHQVKKTAAPPVSLAIPSQAFRPEILTNHGTHLEVDLPRPESGVCDMFWFYEGTAPQGPKEELYDQLMEAALFQSALSPLPDLEAVHECGLSINYHFHNMIETTGKVGLIVQASNIAPERRSALDSDLQTMWQQFMDQGITEQAWNSSCASMLKILRSQYGSSAASVVRDISANVCLGRDALDNAQNLGIVEELSGKCPTLEDVKSWCLRFVNNTKPTLVTKANPKLLTDWEAKQQIYMEELVLSGHQPQNKVDHEDPSSIDQLPCLSQEDLHAPIAPDVQQISTPSTPRHCAITHFEADTAFACFNVQWELPQSEFSLDDLTALHMWALFAPHVGTKDQDAVKQASWEEGYGVDVGWSVQHKANRHGHMGIFLGLSGTALRENAQHLAQALMDRSAGAPVIEASRWRSVFSQLREQWIRSADDSATQDFAMQCKAPYADQFAFEWQFRDHFKNHRMQWLDQALADPSWAHAQFASVLDKVFQCRRHLIGVGPHEFQATAGQQLASAMVGGKPWDDLGQWATYDIQRPAPSALQMLGSRAMVSHCMRAFDGPQWNDPDAAPVKVALNLVDPKLYDLVRAHGGAYGVSTAHTQGTVLMHSYRDPNVESTFEAFSGLPTLLNGVVQQHDPTRLLEAKLTLFKTFSAPKSSLERARLVINYAQSGRSINDEAWMLEEIGRVTWDDVARVTSRWLTPAADRITDRAAVPHAKAAAHLQGSPAPALK